MIKDKLYAFGDSYTDKTYKSALNPWIDCNWKRWPELVATKLNLKDRNFGVSGSSNERIFVTAVDEIIENHEEIDTVCILWTNLWRFYVYGWNFNPGSNLRTYKNWKGGSKADQEKIRKFYHEDDMYYAAADAFYNWHIENHRDAQTQTIIRFLKNIKTLQKLCKDFNINLYQWAGSSMLHTGRENRQYYLSNKYNRFADLVYKLDRVIREIDIDSSDMIGWPFVVTLGGFTYDDYIRTTIDESKNRIFEKHTISPEDSHPNEKGHELISEFFLKEMFCSKE